MLSTLIGRTVRVRVIVANAKAKDPLWRPSRGESYYVQEDVAAEVVTVYQTSNNSIRYQVLEFATGKIHDIQTDHITVPPLPLPDPYRDTTPPQLHAMASYGPGGVRF